MRQVTYSFRFTAIYSYGEISAFGDKRVSVYCANLRSVLVRWCASFELTVISDVEKRE